MKGSPWNNIDIRDPKARQREARSESRSPMAALPGLMNTVPGGNPKTRGEWSDLPHAGDDPSSQHRITIKVNKSFG